MSNAERLELLLDLARLAGGAENMPAREAEFFYAEGTRLLRAMAEENA